MSSPKEESPGGVNIRHGEALKRLDNGEGSDEDIDARTENAEEIQEDKDEEDRDEEHLQSKEEDVAEPQPEIDDLGHEIVTGRDEGEEGREPKRVKAQKRISQE